MKILFLCMCSLMFSLTYSCKSSDQEESSVKGNTFGSKGPKRKKVIRPGSSKGNEGLGNHHGSESSDTQQNGESAPQIEVVPLKPGECVCSEYTNTCHNYVDMVGTSAVPISEESKAKCEYEAIFVPPEPKNCTCFYGSCIDNDTGASVPPEGCKNGTGY